jgi:hypothetical protein
MPAIELHSCNLSILGNRTYHRPYDSNVPLLVLDGSARGPCPELVSRPGTSRHEAAPKATSHQPVNDLENVHFVFSRIVDCIRGVSILVHY